MMSRNILRISAFLLIGVAILSATVVPASRNQTAGQFETAYWIWRWSDLSLVEPHDPLLLYQGDYHSTFGNSSFLKRGVNPARLAGRTEIAVLIRLYDIADAHILADQVAYLIEEWQRNGVTVTEIQFDYDSPSSQLLEYGRFVRAARSALDEAHVTVPLSITGLLTWLNDDPRSLEQLAGSASYVVYQLYDTYDPVADVGAYLPSLAHLAHPYKIGITTSKKFEHLEYPLNEYDLGRLVFLNIVQ
jgi:hypothetical protein